MMIKSILLGVLLGSVALGKETQNFQASDSSSNPSVANYVSSKEDETGYQKYADQYIAQPDSVYTPDDRSYHQVERADVYVDDQNYQDDEYSNSQHALVKDSYGGSGGGYSGGGSSGGGGYNSGGGYSGGGGYSSGGNYGNGGGGGGGGYQDQNNHGGGYPDHNEGYSSNTPLGGPFSGLLRAGSLLLPILIILGLGLFFPAIVNVPVNRRKRETLDYHPKPATFMDTETLVYATDLLLKAASDDSCLEFIVCKLGEKSESFPLRTKVITWIHDYFLPDNMKRYFKHFVKASKKKKCVLKFPKQCQ